MKVALQSLLQAIFAIPGNNCFVPVHFQIVPLQLGNAGFILNDQYGFIHGLPRLSEPPAS
ncbi:hypothetical protein D3C80_2160010 [compost metagenome]